VTLYELLTLRPAFDHTNKAKLIDRVVHEPPAPPRKLDPRIPRDLETVVLKCLAKDPAERYATAAALAEDLRRFLADRPIRARRTSWSEHTWRWCRRNPAVASLTAFVFLLLVAVAVVSTVAALWLRQERDRVVRAKEDLGKEQEQTVKERDRAEKAEREGKVKLWQAYLDRAQARRVSRQPGQRFDSLRAIQEALKLPVPPGRSLDELRNEAIWFAPQQQHLDVRRRLAALRPRGKRRSGQHSPGRRRCRIAAPAGPGAAARLHRARVQPGWPFPAPVLRARWSDARQRVPDRRPSTGRGAGRCVSRVCLLP
jgi:hypothetical protein